VLRVLTDYAQTRASSQDTVIADTIRRVSDDFGVVALQERLEQLPITHEGGVVMDTIQESPQTASPAYHSCTHSRDGETNECDGTCNDKQPSGSTTSDSASVVGPAG
jgi:hypothetical protein